MNWITLISYIEYITLNSIYTRINGRIFINLIYKYFDYNLFEKFNKYYSHKN